MYATTAVRQQIADAARDAHELYQLLGQVPPSSVRDLLDRGLADLRDRLAKLAD